MGYAVRVLLMLAWWSVPVLAAGPISIEFKGVGPYPKPHRFQATPGATVQVGYYVTQNVLDLASFQTDISTTAAGAFVSVARGNWFSGGGTYDSVVASGTSGPPNYYYRILGYCLFNPRSIDGCGDLAIVSYQYNGPAPVVLDAGAGFTIIGDEAGQSFQPVSGNVLVVISSDEHPCSCYDLNGDRAITWLDVSPFSASYGSSSGTPHYNAVMDYDLNGKVDWLDVSPFSACYGSSW